MNPPFAALLRVHLTFALAATALFWIAALAPKGGRLHRAAGRFFARFIYVAAATGGAMAVIELVVPSWVRSQDEISEAAIAATRQTMWFVLYVLLVIVAPAQHGVATVAAGADPKRLRSVLHTTLNVCAVIGTAAISIASLIWSQWPFLIVAPIGAVVGLRNLRYTRHSTRRRSEWEREHLTSMITAGVTLHTAFFVFGTSRSLGLELSGIQQLIPWVLPALVGVPVIWYLRKKRRT